LFWILINKKLIMAGGTIGEMVVTYLKMK